MIVGLDAISLMRRLTMGALVLVAVAGCRQTACCDDPCTGWWGRARLEQVAGTQAHASPLARQRGFLELRRGGSCSVPVLIDGLESGGYGTATKQRFADCLGAIGAPAAGALETLDVMAATHRQPRLRSSSRRAAARIRSACARAGIETMDGWSDANHFEPADGR